MSGPHVKNVKNFDEKSFFKIFIVIFQPLFWKLYPLRHHIHGFLTLDALRKFFIRVEKLFKVSGQFIPYDPPLSMTPPLVFHISEIRAEPVLENFRYPYNTHWVSLSPLIFMFHFLLYTKPKLNSELSFTGSSSS